jgi:hypothetical protein|tara:strand:+ start:4404 stop:4649 length:246 start_codon:yes stop_codon:yes gene_type:complete
MSKLTDKELETIKNAIQGENQLASRLGAVEFQLNQLNDSKRDIISSMTQLLKDRQLNLDNLREKYNIDTLNIDTGEYTVIK